MMLQSRLGRLLVVTLVGATTCSQSSLRPDGQASGSGGGGAVGGRGSGGGDSDRGGGAGGASTAGGEDGGTGGGTASGCACFAQPTISSFDGGSCPDCPDGQVCRRDFVAGNTRGWHCVPDPCPSQAFTEECACHPPCNPVSWSPTCGIIDTGKRIVGCEYVCAAPDTPVATPSGERRIDSLRPGDLVYSVDHDAFVAVPILRVSRSPVSGHHVVRVALDNGRFVEMSAGHPLPNGRTFGDLAPGATLGSARVLATEVIPYPHPYTHDIEPDSDSGTYVAAGALVGSTLHQPGGR